MKFAPIAIVGRSCVLPGALNPEALWTAVSQGRDLLGRAPEGRWRTSPSDVICDPNDAQADSADRTWSDRGGYVRGFDDVWDSAGFAISAEELKGLDDGVLWALHCAREALRDAGDDRTGAVDRSRVGAIFGNLGFPSSEMTRFAEACWRGDMADTDPRNRFMSGGAAKVLEQALGLAPGVFCLDAACASSLYAIKLACDELHDGRVDLALAGAVNRSDDLFIHVGFSALKAMSRTGQSRPFHADADGLVPAEGAGFVALKRLEDARRDGDHIYGVIRGIGLSNDGRGRGLLAPSEEGQQRALRRAYAVSGLQPQSVSLLECHATGTQLGDATEIRSSASVFDGCAEVPIGSLKSNVGHLITAAGVAALIKVIEAFKHQQRPPTLHVDAPNAALDGSPFRLLRSCEDWTSDEPRVAGISVFGFGGNNAHMLVSEHASDLEVFAPQPHATGSLAVVGLGAVVGEALNTQALAQALASGESLVRNDASGVGAARTGEFSLALAGLRFPPRDLQETLPQQLLLLKAAREAVAQVKDLPRETTGIFVAMEPDVEVCRYGLRWRMSQLLRDAGQKVDDHRQWLADTRDDVVATLTSAGVVGTMPNIPANRLNSQFDLGGSSFCVSAGEGSGLRALDLAVRALRSGELEAAVVCAVDLSCQDVHTKALQGVEGAITPPGDAAVVLVLTTMDNASGQGTPILCLLDTNEQSGPVADRSRSLDAVLGRSWAAGDLRDLVADALVSVHSDGPSLNIPHQWGHGSFSLAPNPALDRQSLPATVNDSGHRISFMSHPPQIPNLQPSSESPSWSELPMQTMKPAPRLPSVMTDASDPPVPPRAFVEPQPQIPTLDMVPQAPVVTHGMHPVMAVMHEQIVALGDSMKSQLEQQVQMHQQFLAVQQKAMATLTHVGGGMVHRGALVPSQPVPDTLHMRNETNISTPSVVPSIPPASTPVVPLIKPQPMTPVVKPIAETPKPKAPSVQVPATSTPVAAETIAIPVGPQFSREQLAVHASGFISEIYGEQFAVQDDYHRQVRMPEPPLLLADRVTGLDAEPGVFGKGTIWSETDVRPDEWYLHQGTMPAGIMIESGQADLMLISWMGVDFTNRGERVYRLLGCELTYHGSLPQVNDTLKYDIHMDGHATQGDVRLMFFHYDCRIDDEVRLSVRKGQAGFFTDAELADSDGCLWVPEEQELVANPQVDAPVVLCNKRDFSLEEVQAFAAGRPWDCFGEGFEAAKPHTRTPRIQDGKMMLLGGISDFDVQGGPWGRGYMKSTLEIDPNTWFFDGHFKNDPCMPGTLMFEGCLQAMAFYLAGLGYTLDRDGGRFEPVSDVPFQLSCRGQVTPTSRVLTYELFVEEVHHGPVPTLYADLLCTVDGLKAFHARRVALRLVPAWPLDEPNPELEAYTEPKPVAESDGFPFDYRSLVACANGRPSEAFGPIYSRFDGPGRVARLPNPPYHFLSRVTRTEGEIGSMTDGMEVDVEYDIPNDAWYFDENGCRAMPFAVLLEAALQPCGWLASYMGCALTTDKELCFRNLDGTGTLLVDVLPDAGTLLTRVKSTSISRTASMIIVGFDVLCSIGDVDVYKLNTVFGFFPPEALENQIGLPTTDDQRAVLEASAGDVIDLRLRPKGYWEEARPKLAEPMLLMLDRITMFDPNGGAAGLGVARGEKDVDPGEWFFKAHFFQDPVQPGSLGIEAMIQLLQWTMLEQGMDAGIENPRFETLGLGVPMMWKYRGQVIPTNKVISSTLEIVETSRDDNSATAVANASLWVDGKRIYEAEGLTMRVVSAPAGPRPTLTLDPKKQPWLLDHCPTWTVPALPMMSIVDLFAQAACKADPVISLRDVRVKSWLAVDDAPRLCTERNGEHIRLLLIDDDGTESEVATARVSTGAYGNPPKAWKTLEGEQAELPYENGQLFHGPAFQVVESLIQNANGASSWIRAEGSGLGDLVPMGRLNPLLLDGATHGIPHDRLAMWGDEFSNEKVAYPALVSEMHFYGPTPKAGLVRCEVRPKGSMGSSDFPVFEVQLIHNDRVWCAFRLVEACFPKGSIGNANSIDRRAFLRDRQFVEGLRLSRDVEGETHLSGGDVAEINWLPGTVEAVFGDASIEEIAKREHIAAAHHIHPGSVPAALPITRFDLQTAQNEDEVVVNGDPNGTLDLTGVRAYWNDWFDRGPWPVEDLYYGLIKRFVGKVVLTDPDAFAAVRGKSLLFLGNHQVGVESLLFSIIASGLGEVPTVTLAKAEHRETWLGKLIAHCFAYPGVADPKVIAFFDREDKASLPQILKELAAEMMGPGRSVMVHVEGTRSLSCRTPVEKMSGAFLDMAMQVGAPVVPIRFVGALPADPLEKRIEFPVGMGTQDIYIGRPIHPSELATMHYGERKRMVIDAINALGPSNENEAPNEGDPGFADRALAWQKKHGVTHEHAVLGCVLNETTAPVADVQRLLDNGNASDLGDKPEDHWLAELGRRIFGASGAE